MPALVLVRDQREVQVIEIGAALHLGRAPTNDLVLVDGFVSAHHCVIWADAGEVWVEDLGSANGTWVDGERIQAPTALGPAGRIAFAAEGGPRLVIRDAPRAAETPCWIVEDRTAGIRVPLRADRFAIGSHADADLRLPGGPERAATLLVHGEEVWLGIDDEDRPVAPGERFAVLDHELLLVPPAAGRSATVHIDPDRYDYRVTATLDSGAGPEAVVEHRRASHLWRTADDNRAVLLYLLARQLHRDRGEGQIPATAWGWVEDEALISGIWGRARPADEVNSLNVLIHRIRRGVRASGLDPWFIEKQRRAVRMRVSEVRVA